MSENLSIEQKNLVLKYELILDPRKYDLDSWEPFIDKLCGDRQYQKNAIKAAVAFLLNEKNVTLEQIALDNYSKNIDIRNRYSNETLFLNSLPLRSKLYGTIDLATGTGKSYVIYGIAQILLGFGVVDKVLVLCPSLTIESGLQEKFIALSGDQELKALIPQSAIYRNPRIIDANVTIKNGDVCIENIHAVYSSTGSSINDSLKSVGQRVLVLNDEAHHIFNRMSDTSDDIKKWLEFLLSDDYKFRFIMGFTGTAYSGDEYFSDVIFRYSLKSAIEDKIIKNVDYVKEDESETENEKFQKIYQNHKDNIDKFSLVKPLTILITKDIDAAETLTKKVIDFLVQKEQKPKDTIESKVLIVTSKPIHKANVRQLKFVDDKTNQVQWIISVSMLTEGWDVKNVFQIVPWEDRAFNSKLLISQVLGRGLRLPPQYQTPQPKVIVFNHKSWSLNIRKLVEEILEIETKLTSSILSTGDRSVYNFTVQNLNNETKEIEIDSASDTATLNYSKLLTEGILLESQSLVVERGTVFQTAIGSDSRTKNYSIEIETWTIDEVLDKLYEDFEQREWEGKVLKLAEDEYTKNSLPPRETIKQIIEVSMKKSNNSGDLIIEKNVLRILNSFSTLLRKRSKSVTSKVVSSSTYEIETRSVMDQTISLSNLYRDSSVFYTANWESENYSQEQLSIFRTIVQNEDLPRKALREVNQYMFKTPLNFIFTNSEPERKFVELLCKRENSDVVHSWIKSRDRGFYSIEYSYRYGSRGSRTRKYTQRKFNPDFFIKIEQGERTYFVVVEVKMDGDDTDENKSKYIYALEHFKKLNEINSYKNETYIFHFLSPNSFATFFDYLRSGKLLESQSSFVSDIETMLMSS